MIVEQGKKFKYHKLKCDYCSSILKYTKIDEEKIYCFATGEVNNRVIYYITCPVCKEKIITHITFDNH